MLKHFIYEKDHFALVCARIVRLHIKACQSDADH